MDSKGFIYIKLSKPQKLLHFGVGGEDEENSVPLRHREVN